MLLVARTAARVEDLIVECSDCRALYDARLDLEVALEKLYWLIPDRGLPWMERKTYDGTRNWYEITDLHHRSLINRWAGIYAKNLVSTLTSVALSVSISSWVKTFTPASAQQVHLKHIPRHRSHFLVPASSNVLGDRLQQPMLQL